jgi:hypothetical protein
MLNLLVFWLGGMAAGIATALVVLFLLRDFTLSLMREVDSAISSQTFAYVQVVIGVLAGRLWARQRAPVPVTGGGSSVLVLEPNATPGSGRLSIRGHLECGSLVVAFVAGLALATPPVEYLAAMVAILTSGATAAEQLCAALIFTVVAFTVVEVPLITYLTAPAKTLAVVNRLNDWRGARRQPIIAAVVGVFGAVLMVTGMRNV